MKMGTGMIIGIIIILLGLSMLFNGIPFFRIAFGLLLVFWGVSVIIGGFGHRWHWWKHEPYNAVFSESNFNGTETNKEYNVIFGKGTFDFRNVVLDSLKNKDVQIHTVFGGCEILVNKSTPYKITANSVFAGAEMPNGNTTAMGSVNYQSSTFNSDSTYLNIQVDVVFGGLKIREY